MDLHEITERSTDRPGPVTVPHRLDLCYILMQPYDPLLDRGEAVTTPTPKDAPYFFDLDIEYRYLKAFETSAAGVDVHVQTQVLNDEVWVAECLYTLGRSLDERVIQLRQNVNTALRDHFVAERHYSGTFTEEYTVLLVSELQSTPDEFVGVYQSLLAQALRSSDRSLDVDQTQLILQSRTRYAGDDLTIVDWEGAVAISKTPDFRTEIELFKIGNYQLLRYRTMDTQIDFQLQQLRSLIGRSFSWFPRRRDALRHVVESRLGFLLDFEHTDQSLLLIGDWYPAQLYRVIYDEFYIDEWKDIVSRKLEYLSSITDVVQGDLTISWARLLDIIQIIGWMVILLGSLFLFLRDARVIP
jgi:hypothetical protein